MRESQENGAGGLRVGDGLSVRGRPRDWFVFVCVFALPLLVIAEQGRSFDAEAFSHMESAQKGTVLKNAKFDMPASRSNVVAYFTARWSEEPFPVVAAFCEAMGNAKVEEAMPILVLHIDFRYSEDMYRDRTRTILDEWPAVAALVKIGLPAVNLAASEIAKRLSMSQERPEISFLCEALYEIVSKSMQASDARQYVRSMIDQQKDEVLRRHLQSVEGRLRDRGARKPRRGGG